LEKICLPRLAASNVWKNRPELLKNGSCSLNTLFVSKLLGYKKDLMDLTGKAEKRLLKLLPQDAAGFSVEGFIGTCRGSTPILKPAQQAHGDQETLETSGLTFYLNPEIAERFRTCSLDYDRSFLGKGLTATWTQCEECACHS